MDKVKKREIAIYVQKIDKEKQKKFASIAAQEGIKIQSLYTFILNEAFEKADEIIKNYYKAQLNE
jgi:uncharacterized protein (DUF1778 family)